MHGEQKIKYEEMANHPCYTPINHALQCLIKANQIYLQLLIFFDCLNLLMLKFGDFSEFMKYQLGIYNFLFKGILCIFFFYLPKIFDCTGFVIKNKQKKVGQPFIVP